MSRRSSGEGTVFRASSGYWRGAIRLPDGRRIWRTARTRSEVVAKLDEIRRGSPTSRETFGHFLARWLDQVKPNVRANTFVGYETIVRLHIKPTLGDVRLSAMRVHHAEALLSGLRDRASPRTIASIRGVGIMALAVAERWGLVSKNWFRLTASPRRKAQSTAKPFSPDEAVAFLLAAATWRDGAFMTLAAHTGARRGELLASKWQDFALCTQPCKCTQPHTWEIRRTLQRVNSTLTEFPPKSEAGYRRLAIPPQVVAALKEHRVRQLEMRLKAGATWADSDYVFTGDQGQPLQPEYVSDSYHALLVAASLPKRRFHDLRHTAATLLLLNGTPVKLVQQYMGHATATITLDVYGHYLPGATGAESPLK